MAPAQIIDSSILDPYTRLNAPAMAAAAVCLAVSSVKPNILIERAGAGLPA